MPTRRLGNVVSPGAVVCLQTQWPWAGGRGSLLEEIQETTHPRLFFLFLNYTHTGFWECGLSRLSLLCEVRSNTTTSRATVSRREVQKWILRFCAVSSAQLLPEPRWQPACLPRALPVEGWARLWVIPCFSKLTGFSLGKQETEEGTWLLRYFLENFLMFSMKRFMPQT